MITSADNSRTQVEERVVLVELVNRGKSALEMVYVCRDTKGCLLSLKACIALEVVLEKFPEGQVRETSDRMECKDSDKEEVKDTPGKDNDKKGATYTVNSEVCKEERTRKCVMLASQAEHCSVFNHGRGHFD